MDERLPLGSLDAPALRMLLEKARMREDELVQDVRALQAGLARQNERITALERENTALRQVVAQQQQLIAGLQEQNALLREQVVQLQAENARLPVPITRMILVSLAATARLQGTDPAAAFQQILLP